MGILDGLGDRLPGFVLIVREMVRPIGRRDHHEHAVSPLKCLGQFGRVAETRGEGFRALGFQVGKFFRIPPQGPYHLALFEQFFRENSADMTCCTHDSVDFLRHASLLKVDEGHIGEWRFGYQAGEKRKTVTFS